MIIEMLAKTCYKRRRGIGMLLRAACLQAVGGRQDAHPAAGFPIQAQRLAAHKAAAEGITHAGWVKDLLGRYYRDEVSFVAGIDRGPLLAQRDYQQFNTAEKRLL